MHGITQRSSSDTDISVEITHTAFSSTQHHVTNIQYYLSSKERSPDAEDFLFSVARKISKFLAF